MIEVKLEVDSKNATNAIDRFMNKNVGMVLGNEISQQLVEEMKSLVPVWHGNLKKSIQSVKTNNGYYIKMNFYSRFLEEGHKITIATPTLKNWAFTKPIPKPDAFLRMIYWSNALHTPYYARPHEFIQPSIDKVMSGFDTTSIKVIRKTLKESGFNEN